MPRKSKPDAILSALENLTVIVGKLQEKVEALETPAPKLDLSTAEIATGQLPESESLAEKNSPEKIAQLESIFATNKVNVFGTTDLTIFEERLKNITTPDLQALAAKVGVNPTEAEYVVKANLRTAFLQGRAQNGHREIPKPRNIAIDPNNPKHLKMIQALNMRVGG
ncbi:MAG: hypothetical protein FMNOHCHN_03959 [Ignavibacteriaceae bacterium]|nr:hypothetical protein [Ignavibacteriaceae bacterium]